MNKQSNTPMAAAEAVASTGAPAATTEVPTSNVVEAGKKPRAPKNPENKLDIINGRLPLPLVFVIRFKEATGQNGALAKKFGTSIGKVFDIQKNRNFDYVTAAYKPSAEEVKAANDWCDTGKTAKGKTLKEAGGDPDAIKVAVAALGVATPEEVAARGWQTRVVGKKADAATAPVAEGSTSAAASKDTKAAPAGAGAKLF